MQSNMERVTEELEGWVVGIDTKNSVINVEHFPSHGHTCMRENKGASRSLGPSAGVDERPLRFAFKVPPSRLLQTKVGCRVIVERTKRRSEIAGGGHDSRSNAVVDGVSVSSGGSDSFRLLIPQPKREREQRGVIERIVHKGMCVVAVKGLLNTVAQRHNEKGSGERTREEEQVCLLWSAVEKDAEQMAIISAKFGADCVKRDMFLSTGALCENKEGKETAGSDDAANVFIGLPVEFSVHSGTSVVKTVRFLFDQPFCEGLLSASANSKGEMVVGKKSTKGVSWVDDDNNEEESSNNVLVDEPPAKKADVDNTEKETPVVAANHISNIVKDQPNLSRGGTKLNAGNNRALQRATNASDTPPLLPSGSSSNASLIGTAISATLAQQSGSPSSPNTVPSVALMGSWEVSSAPFSTIAADLASAARTRQHMHQQQQQCNNAGLSASNPVVAVQCLYQQMALENHTPPLVSQESDLKIGIGLGIIAYAEQAAAEIAKRKKEEEEEGSHVVTSLSPSVVSSSSSARVAISILDDDGEDVTECVCVITPAAGSGDSVYEYFNISVLPFEMEGSCCEVRIKISVFVVDDHDDDDDTGTSDIREKKEDDSSSGNVSPIVELTSRPFFARPSVASLAARRNKFYRSSTAEDLASSSALLAVSPYSQDSCSSKFWTRDYLTPTDRIENGFIDPGRSNPLLDPDALINRGRENDGGEGKDRHKGRGGGFGLLDASTSSALLSTMREREVLLIDEGKDKTLCGWVVRSQQMLSLVMDTKAKVLSLAWFVIAVYGGTNVTDDVFDASMSRIRFGRDTRRSSSGRSATSARGGASSATLRGGGAGSLTSGVMKQSANTLCLGSIPIGLCRHRALLFKYLCDKNNLMCYLVRGTFAESAAQAAASPTTQSSAIDDTKMSSNNTNGGETSRHSWCVVLTGGCGLGDTIGGREMLLVDCTHPSEPVRPWPQLGYACPELPPHAEPVRTSDLCGQNGGADQADTHEKTANVTSMETPTAKRNECMYHCFFAASAKEQVPILQEEVGRGAVAVVHRATFGGLSCALKVPHCATDEEDLRREYAILSLFRTSSSSLSSHNIENADGEGQREEKELHHQRNNGIVQCLGWCGGLLLEYMPFSLLGFMNSLLLRRMALRAAQIREVLTAVTRALALVHSKGYVHRDVKTENILLYPERCEDCMRTGVVCPRCSLVAKLADFADCCKLPSQPNSSSAGGGGGAPTSPVLVGPLPVVGTAPYAAPEIEAEVPFGAAADIWSLGILAVELFLMRMPMPNTSGVSGKFVISPYLAEPSTQKKKKSSEKNAPPSNAVFVPSLELKTAPVWGVSFVEGCLKVRMEERLSCEALLKILESAR